MKVRLEPQRILDFDIETRRIGFHSGGRWKPDGCEPIAVAWSWTDEEKVDVIVLGADTIVAWDILDEFRDVYDQADIVTGHYIRPFDLPILNGAMMEYGLPPLDEKLTSDTKLDLVSRAGLSASQENLSALYELVQDKFHMNDHRWREAARLTPEGLERARRRVVDDVKQHKALRRVLIEAGFLKPPKVWRP